MYINQLTFFVIFCHSFIIIKQQTTKKQYHKENLLQYDFRKTYPRIIPTPRTCKKVDTGLVCIPIVWIVDLHSAIRTIRSVIILNGSGIIHNFSARGTVR